jgi:serine/threonine-protein kinase HipA
MILEVLYNQEHKAGELRRNGMDYIFKYEEDYLNNAELPPISVNFPKISAPYISTHLFPFFQAMLSEGDNRKKISNALGIDPSDDWNLLAYTCAEDTIGAITIKRTK